MKTQEIEKEPRAENARLRENVGRLKDDNAKLRDGILKAWQAMDSYGTAKADAWKEEWKHILSNAESSYGRKEGSDAK